ncbi:hypothetical protein ACOMHN_049876 [Nucella lapillus]
MFTGGVRLRVPAEHHVVISFRLVKSSSPHLRVLEHFPFYDPELGRYIEYQRTIFSEIDHKSSNAKLFNISEFSVIGVDYYRKPPSFKLFYSFLPAEKGRYDASTRTWNCSRDDYPSFQHHVSCDLRIDCEDGRDENEHCPFSSPECQGLIDMCNHCYKVYNGLCWFDSDLKDVHHLSDAYCNTLRGSLRMPGCVSDVRDAFHNATMISFRRIRNILTGLTSSDTNVPVMYTHMLMDYKSVVYHSHTVVRFKEDGNKGCFKTVYSELMRIPCVVSQKCDLKVVCEVKKNGSSFMNNLSHLTAVSLKRTHFCPPAQWLLSMMTCPTAHVTHTFLVCGSNRYDICGQKTAPCTFSPALADLKNSTADVFKTPVATYLCTDGVDPVSFTLVCDFIEDCRDGSDESFCHHPDCEQQFTCTNGQCVSYDLRCDQLPHCIDHSDEKDCEAILEADIDMPKFFSPAFINFDGTRQFRSVPMLLNQSCPDSHYQCVGEMSDCLPVYTRCNGIFDCLDHEDEADCEHFTCPGFFRCRISIICVHADNICDGWPHCPLHDDELACDAVCAEGCLCQGHALLCSQPISLANFPQLRSLYAAGSGMALTDMAQHSYIVDLVLAHCSLTAFPSVILLNLKFLDLSANSLRHINITSFHGLVNLQRLSLSSNPLASIRTYSQPFIPIKTVRAIDLSHTNLSVLDAEVWSSFPGVQTLNLSSSSLHTIIPAALQSMPGLTELYMKGSPVQTFHPDIFKGLSHLKVIVAQNYKLCCSKILPANFDASKCYAPTDEISSCEDLLRSWSFRVFLWVVTCLSLTGNAFCLCTRLFLRSMTSSSGFSVFVTNLTIADFLMGVYNANIGVADARLRRVYLHHDEAWKHSTSCKVAGFLSLLSSEVSALIIWLITLDRFIVIHFPFSVLRFERKSASMACLLTWVAGFFLALFPLLPVTSHWNFYSQTGICIPLPITRRQFQGKIYSFSVLIVLNFILFMLISLGQACIYWSVQRNALKVNTTKVSRDVTIARRLISVAVTDFMCWFPVGLCGILALAGLAIPGEINIALAIFVLPLNSAINPFIYTFNALTEKQKKAQQAKFLKWLETHSELTVN